MGLSLRLRRVDCRGSENLVGLASQPGYRSDTFCCANLGLFCDQTKSQRVQVRFSKACLLGYEEWCGRRRILIRGSSMSKSGSEVTKVARLVVARAAAKPSAYPILCLYLNKAAKSAGNRSMPLRKGCNTRRVRSSPSFLASTWKTSPQFTTDMASHARSCWTW